MKNSKVIGITCGTLGAVVGSYFSFTAIHGEFIADAITGQQAGIYSAISAVILGISLAVIGALSKGV